MAYILYIAQFSREHLVGIFHSEDSVRAFIHKIPFVTERRTEFEGQIFTDYIANYDAVPQEWVVSHQEASFLITQYMFLPNEEIFLYWREAHEWDAPVTGDKIESSDQDPPLIEGSTIIEGYSINNTEVIEYIREREALIAEVTQFYSARGYTITRELQGSEDGEALYRTKIPSVEREEKHLSASASYLFAVDPYALRRRAESKDLASFLRDYVGESATLLA